MTETPALFEQAKPKKKPVVFTEEEMLKRLRVKYTETRGNGDAWAFCTHVRNAAGFDANRTIDAIAMSLWPSRGLELLGFEVKCSRSDWVRELQKPDKAESFAGLVDRWFLVVSDADFVHEGELPPTWGLIAVHGKGLRILKDAPRLRPAEGKRKEPLPPSFSRSFLAALLRSANKSSAKEQELRDAVDAALAREREERKRIEALRTDRLEDLQARVTAFEEAAGFKISAEHWAGYGRRAKPEDVGRVVKLVLAGEADAEALERRLSSLADQADRIAAEARSVIAKNE
jgi:hypothetical protein